MLSAGDNILNMFLHLRSERATLTPRPTMEKTRPSRAHGDREKESFQRGAMATDASSQRCCPPSKVLFPKRIFTFPSAPRRYFSFRSTKATSEIYDLAVDQGNTRSFSIRWNDQRKDVSTASSYFPRTWNFLFVHSAPIPPLQSLFSQMRGFSVKSDRTDEIKKCFYTS